MDQTPTPPPLLLERDNGSEEESKGEEVGRSGWRGGSERKTVVYLSTCAYLCLASLSLKSSLSDVCPAHTQVLLFRKQMHSLTNTNKHTCKVYVFGTLVAT